MKLDEESLKAIKEENYNKGLILDTKQHCLKIIQGIGKFNQFTAGRAIWELVQNARDQSDNVHIRIELNDSELIFAHKGRVFNYDSLSSLIKQVSSVEKEDAEAAGQFGTGFLTTHKFSRVLTLYGSYEISPDTYVSLDGFRIDRSADDLEGMRRAMVSQLKAVDDLPEKDITEKQEWTEFHYELNSDERKNAATKGVESALNLIQYVMIFNDRIEECSIKQIDGTTVTFKKTSEEHTDNLYHTVITKNDSPIDIYSLRSADNKDRIILPLLNRTKAYPLGDVPHLFIFFPLLGIERFGMNYMFHSERFYPTEQRDLIVLPDGNEEIKHKATKDEKVLNEVTEMLFDYLRSNVSEIRDSKYLAPISFDNNLHNEITDNFLGELHSQWVEEFKNLPFLEIDGRHCSIEDKNNVAVLEHSIVDFLKEENNMKYLVTIYEYASLVATLPAKNEVIEWSDIIYQWNSENDNWFITVKDIVDNIVKNSSSANLHSFLAYLRDSNQEDYFKEYPIIPNRESKLLRQKELRSGKEFPKELYDAAKTLVGDFTDKLVDENYEDIYDFGECTRDELRTALNTFVDNEEKKEHPFENIIDNMIDFCMLFPTELPQNTSRYNAMVAICKRHNKELRTVFVQHLGDVDKEQSMYRIVFEALVKYEFRKIVNDAIDDTDWYKKEDNSSYLYDLLNALSNKERPTVFQNKLMPEYSIFPNQNGRLCKPEDLRTIADDTEHTFSQQDVNAINSYYQTVMGVDKKDVWVDERYKQFVEFREEKIKSIADEIDEQLMKNCYAQGVTLDIISHLDQKEPSWLYWFSNIENNKAKIFLERIEEKSRSNVYTLMKSGNDKLQKLATLAGNEKMEEIISEGQKVVDQKEFQRRHNCFINKLGEYVENLLFESLSDRLDNDELEVEVTDEQGGQDYLVKVKGEIVYYVEVKSRWQKSDSVEMSPLQFKTSVEHKDCYTLCYVDMTWKDTEKIGEREYDDIDTCLQHTKVLHDIGEISKWCLESVSDTREKPHIGGSYSLTIPQELFKSESALGFESLVERVKEVIERGIR